MVRCAFHIENLLHETKILIILCFISFVKATGFGRNEKVKVRENNHPSGIRTWPDSSVGRALTYNVRGREFESRSGRLLTRTFTFLFYKFR